ncbi:MAG: SH3 domain-containing protein [Pseudorhodobacter sp.]
MIRLMLLLSATMFLVLLIGGEDRGQMRQGLVAQAPEIGPTETGPTPAAAAAPTQGTAAPVPEANLVAFVPMSPPTPEPAVHRSTTTMPLPQAAPPESVVDLVSEPAPMPLLFVNSNAINVRQGPSTNFAVVGRLTRNESVLVVQPEENGWVRIRIEGDGVEGFVAARLMTDRNPTGN